MIQCKQTKEKKRFYLFASKSPNILQYGPYEKNANTRIDKNNWKFSIDKDKASKIKSKLS